MSLFAKDKNGSSGPAFFWQAQLQKIEWYNTDKKKRIYNDDLLIDTLWCQFSYNLDVRSNFGKFFVRKKLVRWTILILSML